MKSIVSLIVVIGIATSILGQASLLDSLALLPNGTEISVGLIDGAAVSQIGFTVEDHKLKPVLNAQKLFEIGSISKVFTTIAALQVLERNDIDIQDPITIPGVDWDHASIQQVSYKNLMTHTAGFPKMPNNFVWSFLRSPSDPFLHYCEQRMLRYLKHFKAKKERRFKYSNLGMGLLAFLAANMEEIEVAELLKDEVFHPLSMEQTSLGVGEAQYSQIATTIKHNGKPKHTWAFSEVTAGAGGVYSNVKDLSLFVQQVIAKEGLSTTLREAFSGMETLQFEVDEQSAMGLGWRINRQSNELIHYHGGITYGFKSLLAVAIERQKGIVILTNAKGLSRKVNLILKEICFNYLGE